MTDQPTADQALRRLEPLVGEWEIEVTSPDGERWPGRTTASFEWHESRAHLVQRATAGLPEAPDGITIIGCDGANDAYFALYSDERGVCRVYEMSIDDREWTLLRHGEPFAQRFTGRFSEDGDTITAKWELAEDGETFRTDFDLVYRRVRP